MPPLRGADRRGAIPSRHPNHEPSGLHVPRSRNTSIRRKNTRRAEARRRYRDEQRDVEADPNELEDGAEAPEAQPQRSGSMFAMPNVVDDIKALPMVFRKPLSKDSRGRQPSSFSIRLQSMA